MYRQRHQSLFLPYGLSHHALNLHDLRQFLARRSIIHLVMGMALCLISQGLGTSLLRRRKG